MTDATPDPRTLDDHAFAVWAAEQAGQVLLEIRATSGLEGRALKDAGDAAAQELPLACSPSTAPTTPS